MATITMPGMLLDGTHAARPAANTVGGGTLYACSDHGLIYQSDGSSWSTWFTSTGSVIEPWAVVPDAGIPAVAALAFSAANRGVILPCTIQAGVTVTGVRYKVGTSSGNLSVALYDESLNRLATSGAVACPASGQATTSFSASYAASPGRYWLAMSCDNTTATFDSTNYSGTSTPLAKLQSSAHPLPDPFVPSSSDSRAPALYGIITGGWAP